MSWLTHQVHPPPLCFLLQQQTTAPPIQSRGFSVSYRRPTRIPKREQPPPFYWEGLLDSPLDVAHSTTHQQPLLSYYFSQHTTHYFPFSIDSILLSYYTIFVFFSFRMRFWTESSSSQYMIIIFSMPSSDESSLRI